jgi:hypothetical protein
MVPRWFKAARLEWEHRRRRQRIERYFNCTWQSPFGVAHARVSSLSPTGCYIENRFLVPKRDEEILELTVDLPTGPVTLEGLVIDAMPGVGFAVRFTRVEEDARECLSALVQQHAAVTSPE